MKRILHLLLLMLTSFTGFSQWMDVGGGVTGTINPSYAGIYNMTIFSDKLFVFGGYDIAGSDTGFQSVATWDGHHWEKILPGNAGIYTSHVFLDNKLYIGGRIDSTGFSEFLYGNGISRWNGTNWEKFTYGIPWATNNPIYCLQTFHNKLYAGGCFQHICNTPTDCINVMGIAAWDGTSWSNVGGGPGGFEIRTMIEYNGKLIAGGDISNPPYYHLIAQWNDTSWSALGRHGLCCPGLLTTMVVDTLRNILYVGGGFNWADGKTGYYLAQWDGRQWQMINQTHFSVTMPYLCMYHNDLYMCSIYPTVLPNGDTISGIMKWKGKEWEGVGARFTTWDSTQGSSGVMAVYHDTLYFGGNLDYMNDTIPLNNIARMYASPDTSCKNLLGNYNKIWAKDTTYFCNQAKVNFDNNTFYYADHWRWDFGDGGSDTVPAPHYTYDEAGQYDVQLITTYKNCIDTAHKTIAILPCDSLHVYLYGPPDTITMTEGSGNSWFANPYFWVSANSSIADFSYYWDTGDGHQDTGYFESPNWAFLNPYGHIYYEGGTYYITLVVKQDCCYDTIRDTITIVDPSGIEEIQKDPGYIGQNIPNPFKNNTTIPYYVPPGSTGSIFIVDMNGKLIEKFELDSDKNQLEISLKQYRSGVYFYSIKIDGQVKQTRQMVLVE